MPLGTLFSEGWNESWVAPVAGTGGAPRQGWINAQDGVFYRLAFTGFTDRQSLYTGGNQYLAYTTIFLPISRRFEIRVDVPWYAANPVGNSGYHSNFGNLTIYPRVLLHETQNTTVVLEMPVRTGTGSTVNGNGYTSVGPNISAWRNIAGGWVLRGGAGATIPTGNNPLSIPTTVDAFLALGNYITPHNALPFGDFVYYVSTIVHTPVNAQPSLNHTFCSLTPGFRCHMGADWYILGGMEVPVVGPQLFRYAPTVWLMKVF
ncbi:MAG TPA: hypothetical protein VMF30_00505 [Pirellulales bacterium]|nr:hypothetical protein [Pirellulales bacterium]